MMNTQTLGRLAVVLSLSAALGACAFVFPDRSGQPAARSPQTSAECARNPSRCDYEGSYEKGEREYAEDQAADLNKEELDRLRRVR